MLMFIRWLLSICTSLVLASRLEATTKKWMLTLVILLTVTPMATGQSLTKADLVYEGAIRTPQTRSPQVTVKGTYPADGTKQDGMNFGGKPFALDLVRQEFLVGTRYSRIGRLKMVAPAMAKDGNVNSLPVATYVDGLFHDVSNNTWKEVSPTLDSAGTALGGVALVGTRLVVSGTIDDDANGSQAKSMFTAEWPIDTIRPVSVTPWKAVGSQVQGLIAGPMAVVPDDWKPLIPGDLIAGQGGLPIITRNSAGPCAIAFHSNDVATVDRPTAKMLVCYPSGHWMAGHPWDGPGPSDYYTASTSITGMAFVGDNLVFGGSIGYGRQCYGNGTSNKELDGTKGADGAHLCYDPTSSNKGNHGYPYRAQLWVYTKAQIAEVIARKKQPWESRPRIIKLDELPFTNGLRAVNGIAFDPTNKMLYVNMYAADRYGYEPGR